MKKILIAILISYSMTSYGQKLTQAVSNDVDLEVPAEAKKMETSDAQALVNRKFKGNKALSTMIAHRDSKNMFAVSDILITLIKSDGNFDKNGLIKMKAGLDAMGRQNPSYSSELKVDNNRTTLVTNYLSGDLECYRFYTFNEKSTKSLAGIIEFTKSDHDKATSILNRLSKSIRFKN